VGCHPGTIRPLGVPADGRLHRLRHEAHLAFDRLWVAGHVSRSLAYAWLAGQLGIKTEDCHVGGFDAETCEKVITLSAARLADIHLGVENGNTEKDG
jgi:hypothetical protein